MHGRCNCAFSTRFPTVRDFASYCRLVKSKESAGKVYETWGNKIGNAHLK
jgi:transposase